MSDFLKNLIPQEQKEITVEERMVKDTRSMEEIFNALLPDSLYMNHYELHRDYSHHSAESWRRFLKENDRFILQEVAAITEANARSALKKLAKGDLKQGDATAINSLLNRSEQINLAVKDKTSYVMTFMPDPDSTSLDTMKGIAETVKDNRKVAEVFYPYQVFSLRKARGEIVENADGTLHFPQQEATTHLDRVYMHFHNPENKLVAELEDGEFGWQ